MPDCQIIILAAGGGTRMKASLPKVMHQVGARSMLDMVVENARSVTDDVALVYSEQLLPYLDPFKSLCKLALQDKPLGTASAVHAAFPVIDHDKTIAVLFGDNPFISHDIIIPLLLHLRATESAVTTLVFERDDPGQYGRIVLDQDGNFLKIVEYKFATDEELKITLCNSGIMAFAPGILQKYLPQCLVQMHGESVKELYLTDIIEVCQNAGEKVSYFFTGDSDLVVGINTQEELSQANRLFAQLPPHEKP